MARINLDPLLTFSDGSQLVVSTQHSGEGNFVCELFVARSGHNSQWEIDSVSSHLQGPSSMEAQDFAYRSAQRLYPNTTEEIKKPPYLIWHGPPQQR
jgi:hypothetical protein